MTVAVGESVTRLAAELLATAREAQSGRAAHTPVGGSGHALRQTVIALRGGQQLAEHQSPGEATLLVLSGRVELRAGGQAAACAAGDLLAIPPRSHSLYALEDAAVLLTVAKLP
jgi:quercetin dioxygenase-like cupin family protein